MDTFWPLLLLVLFANLVEAVAGFGSTILAVTIGAQLFAIDDLLAMLVPLNILLSLGILSQSYQHIDWRTFLTRILPFAGPGLPVGVFLFRTLPGREIRIVFGVVVVLLGVMELVRLLRAKTAHSAPQPRDFVGVVALFLGGVMQGMYASGGPFIVYFTSRAIRDKNRFRATLSFLWLVMNVVLFLALIQSGKVNVYTLQFTLYLIPAVLLGLFVGSKVHRHVSERTFQIGVYGLLVVAGLALLR